MYFDHQLPASTHTVGNEDPVKFAGAPKKRNGWPVYIRRIECLSDFVLDTGAGGATEPIEIHGMRSLSLSDGLPWGPVRMRGDDLAALDALQTGLPVPYHDGNGDAQVAASQTNAARTVVTSYDFGSLGQREDDLAPPLAKFYDNGSIGILANANPANVSDPAGTTHRIRLDLIAKPEIVAVPRIITKAFQVTGADQEVKFTGKMISLMVRNAADEVAGDITGLDLEVGGVQFLNDIDVNRKAVRGALYLNPEVTSQRMQRNFAEAVGGTEPRYTRLWPWHKGTPISAMPNGPANFTLRGGETPSNYMVVVTYIMPLSREECIAQCEAMGVDRGELEARIAAKGFDEVFRQKTASKMPASRSSFIGYTPFKLIDEELVRAAGLPID